MQPTISKMSRKQARLFWNHLSLEQKRDFNKMMSKLEKKELMMTHIGIDDNEQIQRIVLENKDKPSQPTAPFAKHFHYED